MHQHRKTLVFDKLKRRLRKRTQIISCKTYYLAQAFPILCMVAFLGTFAYTLNVGTVFDYAEETYAAGEDSDIAAHTEGVVPEAKLTISTGSGDYGVTDDSVPTLVASSGMAYRSHNVTLDVNDITKYALTISYASGKSNLGLEGSNAYLMGADGKTPTAMADNTWGYAWDDTTAVEKDMTYYTMPQFGSAASDISNGLLASNDTYNETFTKKLVFGAKFGDNASSGHYKTKVMLSLTANAKEVVTTLDDIFQMQQMTPEICASSVIGETTYLTDTRGGGYTNGNVEHSYQVTKLSDGNCWMTQNLNLTNKQISSNDSNIPKDGDNVLTYTIPAHSTSEWSTSSSTSNKVYYANANGDPSSGDYSKSDTYKHGAYYTWYTATATTSTSATEKYAQASSSICPKGWRLPSAGIDDNATADVKTEQYGYSYNKLVANNNYLRVGTNSDWTNKVRSNGYWLGGKVADAKDAAFFPAAGFVFNGSLNHVGSYGRYWSSTAYDSTSAYNLDFGSSSVNPSYSSLRFYGYSVRCVAERGFNEINTMQEMSPELCKNTPVGYSKALIDSRGGGYTNGDIPNSYVVQKLEDGNCWMGQNMNLTNKALTAEDSDNPKSGYSIPASTAPWTDTSETTDKVHYPYQDNANNDTHKYGAYYTWYTATAGTGDSSVTSGEASGSICPKNWKLPTSGKENTVAGSFNRLVMDGGSEVTAAKAWQTGFTDSVLGITDATNGMKVSGGFFPAAGRIAAGSTISSLGSDGYYWASTVYNERFNTGIYQIYFDKSDVSPSGWSGRYYGYPIRCVVPSS